MAGTIRFDFERQEKLKAVAFNDLGSACRRYEIEQSQQERVDAAYQRLRGLVAIDADRLNFNLSKMTVWYTAGGNEYTKDLQELVDTKLDIKQAYQDLEDLVRPIFREPLRNRPIEKGSKSSTGRSKSSTKKLPPPFQRNTDALASLPNDFSGAATLALGFYKQKEKVTTKHDDALKRIAAAEQFVGVQAKVKPEIELLEKEVEKKQKELQDEISRLPAGADPTANGAIQAKKTEIKKLEDDLSLVRELESELAVDRTVLFTALALTQPAANPHSNQARLDAEKTAKEIQKFLQDDVDPRRTKLMQKDVKEGWPKFLPGFIRGEEQWIPENSEYSLDAGALAFSSLPSASARRGALDFWGKKPKRECLEDDLIRFAIAGEKAIPRLGSIISDIQDAALKTRLQNALNDSNTKARKILDDPVPDALKNAADKIAEAQKLIQP